MTSAWTETRAFRALAQITGTRRPDHAQAAAVHRVAPGLRDGRPPGGVPCHAIIETAPPLSGLPCPGGPDPPLPSRDMRQIRIPGGKCPRSLLPPGPVTPAVTPAPQEQATAAEWVTGCRNSLIGGAVTP